MVLLGGGGVGIVEVGVKIGRKWLRVGCGPFFCRDEEVRSYDIRGNAEGSGCRIGYAKQKTRVTAKFPVRL
jgi:hypothetical protein